MARTLSFGGLQSRTAGTGNLPITVLMDAGTGSQAAFAARAAIDTALKDCGRDVQVLVAQRPRELPILARQAADMRPGILAAAGDDGTLNAVAAVARDRELPLAVIPLGTDNYFARNLGIPMDTAAAARLVADGAIRSVPVGLANGKLFLNSASIGFHRRPMEHGETHTQRLGRNWLAALSSPLNTLLLRHHSFRLRTEIDGQAVALNSPAVWFGRNALQMEELGLDEALCAARGELAVVAQREVSRFEHLGLMVRGAVAGQENVANLRQFCAMKVELDWPDGRFRRIRVAVDGEPADCVLPLLVEAVPDALQVVVPRPVDGER